MSTVIVPFLITRSPKSFQLDRQLISRKLKGKKEEKAKQKPKNIFPRKILRFKDTFIQYAWNNVPTDNKKYFYVSYYELTEKIT